MRGVQRVSAVAVLLALVGCERGPQPREGDDELTIVVEADRSRIEVEEATLREQRRALERERELLDAELAKLGEPGAAGSGAEVQRVVEKAVKLVREQGELVGRRDALDRQRDELLQRALSGEIKPQPSSPGAGSIELERVVREAAEREKGVVERERAIAERERDLAEREKSLAARETGMAQREASCAAAGAAAGARAAGPELSRSAVQRAHKRMLAAMEAKGVLAADLPASKQKALQQAGALSGRGNLARAMDAIETVQGAVESLVVDADFVSRKVKRVNGMKKATLDAKAQQEIARLLQQVTRNYSDGRYREANRSLNDIAHLIERAGGR